MLTFGTGLIKIHQQEARQIGFSIPQTLTVEPIEFSFKYAFPLFFKLSLSFSLSPLLLLSVSLALFSSSLWNTLIYTTLVQTTHSVIKLQAPPKKNLLQLIIHILCHCVLKCSQAIKLVFLFGSVIYFPSLCRTSSDVLVFKACSYFCYWMAKGGKTKAPVITRLQANPL